MFCREVPPNTLEIWFVFNADIYGSFRFVTCYQMFLDETRSAME